MIHISSWVIFWSDSESDLGLANDHVWQCIPTVNAKLGIPVSTLFGMIHISSRVIRFWIWCHLRWMWSVTCAISKMEQYQEERVRWPGSNGTNYISSDARWLRGGGIEEGISISDQSVLLKPLWWLFPKREGLKPNLNMMNGTSPGPVFCVDSGSEVGILIFHLCEVLHPYLYLKCTTRNWSSNSKCFNQ